MRYKPLFRLLLKAVGVLVVAQGLGSFATYLVGILWNMNRGGQVEWYYMLSLLGPAVEVGAGVYLFLGGEWLVAKAIPGNRPYCPECGYDLTGAGRERCPECDTPFRPEELMQVPLEPGSGIGPESEEKMRD